MSAAASVATGFFTGAAAGILGAVLIAPREELGRFFSTLNAGLAAALLGLAAPLRPAPFAAPPGPPSAASLLAGTALALALAFVVILYLPGGRGGRGVLPGGRRGRWVLVAATAAALIATALDGWAAAPQGAAAALFGANALAAAALLGSVIVAMNLGHWYLVRVRLSESHLVRFSLVMGGALAVRAVLLASGLLIFGADAPKGLRGFLSELAIDRGFFFWQRVFFGILGPAVFTYMVYETARIRSTQSATGILYIAVIFVLVGELLARFLTVAGAGPM